MLFKNKDLKLYTLDELEAIDWELGSQEIKFKAALEHPKFEKLKPVPTMNPSFVDLRNEIKKEIEVRKNGN